MEAADALKLILAEKGNRQVPQFGKFVIEQRDSQQIGAGQIYSKVRMPIWDSGAAIFDTYEGCGIILSHECDIDPANIRPFNDLALILPVIPLEAILKELAAVLAQGQLESFLAKVGEDKVSRVMFLPLYCDQLKNGGLLYLNQISHIPVDCDLSPKLVPLSG
jgi:hypothetical protein